MKNVKSTIISQYQNSNAINTIIDGMNKGLDPRNDLEAILNDVWDIRRAKGWGLDNWGRILNTGRIFTYDDGSRHVLEDEEYRRVLMMKAASNISNCSLADINLLLQELFADKKGTPFVLEAEPMVLRYVFDVELAEWEIELLRQEGLLPHPAGMGVEVVLRSPHSFGFFTETMARQFWLPFDNGVFTDINYQF
jgi:hypothetical protein